ncbi:MAG TPA: DUF192 domain-containing protein, partial [Candidatus Dormibacteraeota bacterium]|nr:DUF192 domain-containing protein [Candidatus Dormibacteraeota bacterium]
MLNAIAAALLIAMQSNLPVATMQTPHATLHLWVAQSELQRERGLMDRTYLAPTQGMIFVFSRNDERYFWMKDTLMSLDMIFIESDGLVRAVASSVPVLPRGIALSAIPLVHAQARYVIELRAGE